MSELVVRYFAAAAEVAGRNEETVRIERGSTLRALEESLVGRYGAAMQHILTSGSFLVDGKARTDRSSTVGATVDILPPFAGG